MNALQRAVQPRGLLVAMHLPFVAFTAAQAVMGLGFQDPDPRWSALPLVLTAGATQIHHSLAAARRIRPRHWQWTLLLLVLIAYVPRPLYGARWETMCWYVVASLPMLLPKRLGLGLAAAVSTAGAAWTVVASPAEPRLMAWGFTHDAIVTFAGGASLFAAALLVSHADELRATRAELAELAIQRERLRISRDLHDLLGHSLSAVALKGDLAQRLLRRQELERAAAEIGSLISVARTASRDLREIAHHKPAVSLALELDRCADILAAVGIETRIEQRVDELPSRVDELFAWTVREGVTNIVRHSTASACSIAIGRRDGQLHLDIENDGAGVVSPGGSGLTGLVARATTLSGTAHGWLARDGHFVLTVTVPEEAA